jgi:hypothetical protein
MRIGMNMDGFSFFRRMFVIGSKTAYETKNMVSVALNWAVVRPRSDERPAILALPMLARSRKARR